MAYLPYSDNPIFEMKSNIPLVDSNLVILYDDAILSPRNLCGSRDRSSGVSELWERVFIGHLAGEGRGALGL